ncbi:hypothetical protein Pcinc_030345 [Petrolisthes cinctipes]|uniref:Uncharacterized protein n=1 Tax=Petrolisthes cinctipes TaxID=88211 RepID=A0AAE1EYB4_PETCI|nr:hypothetical protein Pcinc_030345 [Petrolisthes cinctipes]
MVLAHLRVTGGNSQGVVQTNDPKETLEIEKVKLEAMKLKLQYELTERDNAKIKFQFEEQRREEERQERALERQHELHLLQLKASPVAPQTSEPSLFPSCAVTRAQTHCALPEDEVLKQPLPAGASLKELISEHKLEEAQRPQPTGCVEKQRVPQPLTTVPAPLPSPLIINETVSRSTPQRVECLHSLQEVRRYYFEQAFEAGRASPACI